MENKRVALLKPVNDYEGSSSRGVARLKFSEGKNSLALSLVNLPALKDGKYSVVCGRDIPLEFDLENLCEAEFLLPEDFPQDSSVAIVKKGEYDKAAILFGKFTRSSPEENKLFSTTRPIYDDEVVATENYFEYEKAEHDAQPNKNVNEPNENIENAETQSGNSGEEEKEKSEFSSSRSENGDLYGQKKYYRKIKEKLDDLFDKYPEVKSLSDMVKDSKWVKVPYGEGKHYVVGIEYSNGEPRWICYGVPGKYGQKPSEISGYCSFLPSSPFELKSSGYWIMFQDALNGQRLEES
ncbi:MAG: hypothetical protein IJ800_05450 [Clostridia bacterium]|nr:hypothetical protein [Clostridia bacterium]